jgi:hypothetical protein
MNNVAETLYKNGSVWAVSTRTFSGTDKLTASDIGKEESEIADIVKLGRKNLLPKDVIRALKGIRGKVNHFMGTVGRPIMLRGAFFVPSKNTVRAKEGLEQIREEHIQIGLDLVRNFPTLKQQMIEKYPDELSTANWPTDQEILNQFDVHWIVFEIGQVGFNEMDPDELIAAKQKFQKELNDEYEKFKNAALEEARLALIESCDTIAHKILETGDKVTEATLKKPRSIIEKYTHVAELYEMDDIKEKVAELEALMDTADAKEIREDWGVAKDFGDNLRKLADDIDDLSGYSADGTIKRKIKFKRAA